MLMMFLTNWLMALTGIFAALLGFAGMMLVIARSQKYYARQQNELGVINGHVEETISGHNVVKAYNGERKEKAAFRAENERLYLCAWKSQFLSGLMMPLMIFVGNLAYVVVCVVGAVLAVRGAIPFGTIVAFMLYIRLFTQPLQNISQAASSVQSMAAACERVFEFLAEPEMADESGKTKEIQNVRGDISFSHVRFGYDPERVVIKDFSDDVRSGQKIAIVGPTGAGKTTMVNLLMRFYELDGGKISIDGVDIADVRRENVRAQFGMVLAGHLAVRRDAAGKPRLQ
jgi:ATP-binding cassette subfamily B multidrug efflux pump